ncbi:MAG: single-stranded-DNA-specific exonuclease RecJ [Myxococcales bacterium]|jgi:single-stranded-DNA-specific exonuclease|nr:single-stranded-DNA-specific exonuclease RecJ [Myxococcales bacterium]
MRWLTAEVSTELASQLSEALDMPLACARVLAARGFSSAAAIKTTLFETDLTQLPDPFGLAGMHEAVERLVLAIERGERVAIFGDYDVDGVTATATLFLFLREAGLTTVEPWLPRRMREGYGLNLVSVDKMASHGASLLITVDCGVTSIAEITRARELGMDVVVVDHHPPRESRQLPPANVIVDPHLPNGAPGFEARSLCAAGLSFLVCMALRKTLRERGAFADRPEPRLRDYLDLTALGTIADVVPLTGVNRILVRHGLDVIGQAPRPGVRALKKASGYEAQSAMSAGQVSFRLAPRINAVGRLDEAMPGFDLLTTTSPDRARELASRLDTANAERQNIEQRIFDEAMAQAQAQCDRGCRTIVVAGEDWHKGVVGIVASRMVECFHRPSIVLALEGESGTGSGRSPDGVHLAEALARCSAHLTRHGGHSRAAGLSLDVTSLDAFREAFEIEAGQLPPEAMVPACRIDTWTLPEELDMSLAHALKRLEPFGMGNPEPVLALKGVHAQSRLIPAKRGGSSHLKLTVAENRALDIIGFGMGDRASLAAAGPVDLAFHLSVETFQRQQKLSLRLKDIRQAEPVRAAAM